MSRDAPLGASVRAAAARHVARVLDERVAADEVLAEPGVAARDEPLLAALVYGALRWHFRLEWQVRQLLTRPLDRRQTALAALLRIGLLQLQELRIPAHAAVSATVDAATLLDARSAGGLVNAVLRRFQREREQLDRAMQGVPEARFAHPSWLVDAIAADYPAECEGIFAANNAAPPMWLRVNLLRTTRADYLAKLAAAGLEAVPAAEVDSAVRLAAPVSVEALPGFAAGEASVQDLSAQCAAGLLGALPEHRVLDACAAPGGKTGHVLESTQGRAEVWAVERDEIRMAKVGQNLERLGLNATLVTADATTPEQWWDGRPFDRILIDAPCSATGVIRRHPDIKVLRRPADVERAAALQARLLRSLWPLLAPGGRLVYATCSILKRENDEQIAAFLGADSGSASVVAATVASRQRLPEEAGGDGFYYAWLQKPHLLQKPSEIPAQL